MFVNFNILNQLGSPAINSNTFANRPAAGQTGRLFVSTDTFEIYRDNGTTWDLIGGPGSSTITGTGTATQVAYFTSSQAIGSSANLFWDNTNGFLGVATAVPTARIEAVKTDGYGIYANYTTVAGSGSSASAIYAINTTASSGYAAVIEERTGNTTGGQYPLLVKHSLSSGTAAVGNGTGLQFQLQDDAAAFKTTQLTIETIDAAAATYKSRYRFNVQNNGSSTPVAYINATGLGLFTATPGAALDIHSTGIMAQLNSTSATANSLLAFQRSGAGLWRLGDIYNGGTNYFEIYNTVLGTTGLQMDAATNKTSWQSQQTYSTGLARANYFDYNLSVAAGGSFSSPNAITALGASLDLTLAGSATIPSGARSGLDAYNTISFTGTGTLTQSQGTQIRSYSNLTTGWAFNGSATGTITHLAGLRVLFPDNTGSAVTVTNNYGLLINDQTANTGTVTYTNRWGIYQEGASDLNYFAANTLIGTTTNSGEKLNVAGNINIGSGFWLRFASVNTIFSQAGVGFFLQQPDSSTNTTFRSSAGNALMTLNTSGNLGIGTAVPATTLHVAQNNGAITLTRAAGTFGTKIVQDNTIGQILYQIGLNVAGTWRTYMRLGEGEANPSLALQPDGGNVGIGTISPSLKLDVLSVGADAINIGAGNDFSGLRLTSTAGTWAIRTSTADALFFYDVSTAAERARFTSAGNFLIGTTTDAGEKLQVLGNTKFTYNSGVISQFIGTLNNVASVNITNSDSGSSARADFSTNSDSATLNFFAASSTNTSAATGGRASTTGLFTASANTSGGIAFLARNASGVITLHAGGNTERIRVKSTGQMRFIPLAADPAGAETGDVYYNSGTNKLRLYDGTNWVDLN